MGELQAFWREEDAVAVVEIILIVVVLIALVAIFSGRLKDLVSQILDKITQNSMAI
ncbi:MAG: holin, BlyA family protein [Lachnospiraceae bacterium]|nr:holin, BlyA family protein [Lachnospiraceae bacterium]